MLHRPPTHLRHLRLREKSRRLALALVIPALLFQAPGAAQEEPPAPVFGEVLEVRVVNVEVVVTDRQGERVSGLDVSDFELFVDGEEVSIDYFTEVRGGIAVEPEPADATREAQDVPALRPGSPVGTSYLVFVDEYFSYRDDRNRVLEALQEQLSHLTPEDRMALVAYDGQELEMLSNWSGSQTQLERALRRAQGRPAHGQQRTFERRSHDLQRRAATGVFSRDASGLGMEERDYVKRLTDQLERVVLAASSTLRGFGSPPGRKVMVLLSGGWPFDPVDWVMNATARPVFESMQRRGEELFAPLVASANLLGYTLYPVDTSGVQGKGVQFRGPGDELGSPTGLSSVRENEVHSALQHLARETGGTALLDTARQDVLETTVADTRSYYWLGFTPSWQGDDERHAIEVRVLRPDLEVRGRAGFEDLSRQREVTLVVESALLFGAPPSPQPLLVRFGKPDKAGGGKVDVPLIIGIPLDAVTLLPIEGRLVAQLELRVAVIDERGGRNDIPVVPIALAMEEAPEEGKLARYETAVRLRQRPSKVVVAIYDIATGIILSTTAELRL